MKARIQDKLALAAISPAALRAYVLFEGWEDTGQIGKYSQAYKNQHFPTFELVLPVEPEVADYSSAVLNVIHTLSVVEERSELSIYNDLIHADRDVVRLRAPKADEDGSIGIDSGVEIVQHARDMLASAVCAALEPRRAYHVGKNHAAEDFMKRVRLGQTEHGSYVVTLLTPVPPLLTSNTQPNFWPELEVEPFDRKVTRVLTQALHSIREAVVASNRGSGILAFNNVVQKGVSANLCEAIASIVEQTESVDVSVTWARTRPAPQVRDHSSFSRADGEILREAARIFRSLEPRYDERLIGYVTRLARPEDEWDGHITLKTLIDGKVRSLSANLDQNQYLLAVDAHKKQMPIALIGNIEPEGHRLKLTDVREVQFFDAESDLSE